MMVPSPHLSVDAGVEDFRVDRALPHVHANSLHGALRDPRRTLIQIKTGVGTEN
jgi:hypothetical protein